LKIAVQGRVEDRNVIQELLSPWDVSFTSLDDAEIVIVYKEKPLENNKTIVIPSGSTNFTEWIRAIKSRVVQKVGEPILIDVSSQTVLTITPRVIYSYDGLVKLASKNIVPMETTLNENLVVLTLDVVKEFNRILDETLNAKPSTLYRLFTGLPIPYSIAPKRFRDLFMRSREGKENLTFLDKLPLDALRFILVRAIEKLLKKKVHRKLWNGKKYALMITHDVDTSKGLRRAKKLKKIEHKYDVPSAWYLPSKRYKLDSEVLKELVNHGEIGVHGIEHNGKLNRLPINKLIEKFSEAKQTLERIIGERIEGFRAPLLQHNIKILQALRDTGYVYDTSIPTWEPRHSATMKEHGIGTIYPLTLEGITEIPVTLPQDHQLLCVLGLNSKEVIQKWMNIINAIKEIGALCIILMHPEYELADPETLSIYEELLNIIVSDKEVLVSLPKTLISLYN